MSPRTVFILLALALAALGISVYWNLGSRNSGNSPLVQGIGVGCAAETLRVAGSGEVVVVISGEDDTRWKSFQKALAKHSQLRLTPYVVTRDPRDPSPDCPLAAVRDVLQRHRTASAIFFLVKLPAWEFVQSDFTEATGPKMLALAYSARRQEYEPYFQHGRLMTLIISRRTMDASVPVNPQMPQDWFAHDYEIVTPENYTSRLPNPTDGAQ